SQPKVLTCIGCLIGKPYHPQKQYAISFISSLGLTKKPEWKSHVGGGERVNRAIDYIPFLLLPPPFYGRNLRPPSLFHLISNPENCILPNAVKRIEAQLLIQDRSYDHAESLLLSITNSPLARDTYLHLARLYNRTNRTAEALHTILKALNLCSSYEINCAKYHEEHGDILKDMDDFNAAEESYKLALNLDHKLPKTHQNLAVIYHIRGNYTSAEYHYKEAYKLDSSPPVLLDNMRKLQLRLFTVQENTCWRTDSSCSDSSIIS
ncbi:transmembrane and TPR repeat-containing protein 1, partial [Nephila pilipes]